VINVVDEWHLHLFSMTQYSLDVLDLLRWEALDYINQCGMGRQELCCVDCSF